MAILTNRTESPTATWPSGTVQAHLLHCQVNRGGPALELDLRPNPLNLIRIMPAQGIQPRADASETSQLTRSDMSQKQHSILTIAGSDSSGGAGIQADLRAIAACGGFGASVLTALTAQNTRGVALAQEVATEMVQAQLDAVFDDLNIIAVKTGMLSSAHIVSLVARCLRARAPRRFVLDPVMIATSGHALLAPDAVDCLRQELLPLATLVTPNRHEVEALVGAEIRTLADAERAGKELRAQGCQAVLVKGGHFEGEDAVDLLVTRSDVQAFSAPRLDTPHTHGTGCTYAAAIATYWGRGATLRQAVALAKHHVTEAIRGGLPVGDGKGPVDPLFYLRRPDPERWMRELCVNTSPGIGRLHVITDETLQTRYTHEQLAGLAVAGGADVVQYREKRRRASESLEPVATAIRDICRPRTQFIVDDRVDLAATVAAFGVHLGARDMPVREARSRLGPLSCIGGTANTVDQARALFGAPLDYLGAGPVFGTSSKANPAPPLGLAALRQIAAESPVPVIAIGGITPDRVAEVLATGAHGIAVLSGVVGAEDPKQATAQYRDAIRAAMGD